MVLSRRFLHGLAAVIAMMVLFAPADSAEPAHPAAAPIGVAAVDITPQTPVRMYGYGSRTKESEGVAGRLKAKALAIGGDEGAGPAILLSVDCGSVPPELRAEVFRRIAKKYPVALERFVLCNSHTHAGPNLKGMRSIEGEEHDRLARYARQLTNRLVGVVEEALAARQPGRIELARGTLGFADNRRVLTDGKWSGFGTMPGAPVDHELAVLRVTREDGRLVALVANYACHNTTLGGDFLQIHGDWAGCAQEYLEADQPGAAAMITIGCGADSNPGPRGTTAHCEEHGRALADEVKRLLAGHWTPIPPLPASQAATLEIPFAKSPDMEHARRAADSSYPVKALLAETDDAQSPRSKSYEIITWTFGEELAMVFLPNEVVVDYALRLKRELDADRLWITAYANEVSTYIVSKRLIGEGGYEARNSLSSLVTYGRPETLEPAMEDRIVDCAKGLLPETFREARRSGD